MEMVDSEQDLIEDMKGLFLIEFFLLLKESKQFLAFNELTNDVKFLGIFVHSVDLDDVGMVLRILFNTSSLSMLN
jgi:hypothetical protein